MMARWRKSHPERCRNDNRIRRACKVAVGESFSVEEEQFIRECWGDRCAVCGKSNEEEKAENRKSLAIDHWLPLSRGHALTLSNAVLMCESCNSKKGTKLPSEIYDTEFIELVEMRQAI